MRKIKLQVVLLVVMVFLVSACGGDTSVVLTTSVNNLEVLSSTGYHATGKSCVLDNLIAIPIREEIVCINASDGKPFWKYTTTVDRAWTLTWLVSGNNQFLAGFEAGGTEMVVRLSRDKQVLEIKKSGIEASKPIWIEDKWWRMTKDDFFAAGVEIKIPESIPNFIYADGLLVYQTSDGIIQARDLEGELIWELHSKTDEPHYQLFELKWGLALVSEDSLKMLNTETGELFWEKSVKITCTPRETSNGLIFAQNNIITRLDKEGNPDGELQTKGKVVDIAVADDGIAILVPGRLLTFNNEFEPLDDMYLNPKIDEIFVFPGNTLVVSGYSQVFFKATEKE
ncbi:MAG: hypothetical protein KAH30_04925 [Caldisericia bacterium]|nr:hypothetical protein [Caldisericia bacterium]